MALSPALQYDASAWVGNGVFLFLLSANISFACRRMASNKSGPAVDGPTSAIFASEETAPLLGLRDAEQSDLEQDSASDPSSSSAQGDKSLGFLVLLTLVIGGLQTAWTVELGSITPFLQELGLSKALLALVWIAGPLSGTLVQPWVGIQGDNCRSRFGRRRPFMVGGVLATGVTLIALAWTREIVQGTLSLFGIPSHTKAVAAQIWAVAMVYVLDFAINTIQAAIRAFIVDCVPQRQQEKANAVAGVVTACGGILGFLAGQAKLTHTLGWISRSQFQILCVIACAAMAVTLVISCVVGKEPDPWMFGPPANDGFGVIAFFKRLYRSVRNLPTQVKTVCIVEIFAWMGYFPFLFYTTTYIGNIYVQPYLNRPGDKTKEQIDDIYEEGTRRGTQALLVFSVTSLAFSILLPLLVMPSSQQRPGKNTGHEEDESLDAPSSSRRGRLIKYLSSISIHIPGLSLRRAWILGHLSYAVLMWATLIARTSSSATVLIAMAGFPWAMTQWAPFAFIAREISRGERERRAVRSANDQRQGQDPPNHASDEEQDSETQAGIVLGIHNVAVAAPQVVATLVSSIIFKLLQKPRGVAGDDSTGWVFRIAGLCALAAAWWARKIRESD